jgi:two-component system, chemotaxis family, chemotaxis protein CheY
MVTDTQPSSAGLTLLVVDDSAMMRAMIKRVAQLTGVSIASVLEAGNGVEALKMLEAHRIDVLFTDINMPEMTGTELLQEVAKHPEWQRMIRVIVSTDGSQARREEVASLHAHAYVEKPFRPEVMRDVLTQVAPTGA